MRRNGLRQAARGRDCQVRVPSVCSGDPETVVLAHLPGAGMGMKMPDILGAWACHSCHQTIDGAVNEYKYSRDFLYLLHLEGVIRTQLILIEEGKIGAI